MRRSRSKDAVKVADVSLNVVQSHIPLGSKARSRGYQLEAIEVTADEEDMPVSSTPTRVKTACLSTRLHNGQRYKRYAAQC